MCEGAGESAAEFFVGVRTPWTLASDRVWTETHWVDAYLFVGRGILGLLSILIGLPFYVPWIVMGVAVVAIGFSLVRKKPLERPSEM